MTIFDPPTQNSAPYDAVGDPSGLVWFSEQAADKITRFDPNTGTFLEFSVPECGVGYAQDRARSHQSEPRMVGR